MIKSKAISELRLREFNARIGTSTRRMKKFSPYRLDMVAEGHERQESVSGGLWR